MLKPYLQEGRIEAGCDEAGRGCLAGPVYAAAVILPQNFSNDLLNDSKQLSEKRRYQLREVIEREALAWAVGVVSADEIVNARFYAVVYIGNLILAGKPVVILSIERFEEFFIADKHIGHG